MRLWRAHTHLNFIQFLTGADVIYRPKSKMKFFEIFITAKHTYMTYIYKNTFYIYKKKLDKVSKGFRAQSNVKHKLKVNVCITLLKGLLLDKRVHQVRRSRLWSQSITCH